MASMGSGQIPFLSHLSIPISQNYRRRFVNDSNPNSRYHRHRRLSSGRGGGSRWDWGGDVDPSRRSRFSDTYLTDDYDEEDDYDEFRNSAKKRKWWSDDFYGDDEEGDEGFGVLEASIGFNWVLKVFRAFGWLIPAVMASLVLGTGPNSIIMAIALPLAQSAFSLAAETLWGTSYETPRTKIKKRKKSPFARGARAKKEKEIHIQTGNGPGNYKSWVEENNMPWANGKRGRLDFGGWDELDKEPRVRPMKPKEEEPYRVRPMKPMEEERVITSKRRRGDNTPLFMKFLIAMFSHLGFWNELL